MTPSRQSRSRSRRKLAAACFLALFMFVGPTACADASPAPVTVTNYTDPGQAMRFGLRSQWAQPWRSYLDTQPASRMLNAIGINFNVFPNVATQTAKLLGETGFKRARIEVGWGTLSYAEPSQMKAPDRQSLVTTLTALKENGIRPLILFNANDTMPCPVKLDTINLTAPASSGDTEIHVDPSELNKVVLGHTGINSQGVAAKRLFTSETPAGDLRLSSPLTEDLPAGSTKVTTLLYEPFRPVTLEDGSPNPRATATMQGWLDYIGVVTREAKAVLGNDDFDVEVWNEMSFGSSFLNINNYYKPAIEWNAQPGIDKAILSRSVEYLRDPAHGVSGVGIGSGFSSERPWDNGTQSPLGLTAIDKHPYHGWDSFPADSQVNGNRPLNGLGEPAGWQDSAHGWHESFVPTYDSFFPEYFLSGIQTENVVRDLAPYPSFIYGFEHGRNSHPAGGPPPEMWITEVNLDPAAGPASGMSAQDVRHIETKDVLRYLSAYVNKGVTSVDFYAAKAGNLSLVDPGFFSSLKSSSSPYPGRAAGGETTEAVRRLAASMAGAEELPAPRSLSLRELTDYSSNVQFEGDGTAAYPPLYNRDVFGFFPFQVNADRFVIPVYVMTRNVGKVYGSGASPSRFDLPPEPYRLAIGGVDGTTATASVTDPITGDSVPVEVVSRASDEIVVKMDVSDSPRLLTIQEGSDPTAFAGLRVKSGAARPRLTLRGRRRLLQSRRLGVVASCESPCGLRARGRLHVGGHGYTMRARPGPGAVGSEYKASATVELAISARAAKLARLALRHGVRVTVTVSIATTDAGSDKTETTRRVLVLRR